MTQLALGVVALIIALIYGWGISQIPVLQFGDPLGPRLFPEVLTVALIVIGIALIVQGRGRAALRADWVRFYRYVRGQDFRVLLTVSIWTGLYFLFFETLGYALATAAFLLGLILRFHRGNRYVGAAVAILFAGGSYLLFAGLFGVPLPAGLLPF
ncbi:tripartite tricarboxylate transporter TctB family protein [Bordetella sp. N]|uniref:tripartite tricarboxylate transporter TctB family protein n=1 Tax=Bordetella sp. N TaxID=1746199 RepID=UPI00070C57B9|nr:tripartite tricarboxylate transporter TctB family protein [Bordetella sp. N]ALM82260.1 hypothetical protein ASB57_04160 [Bordetella sp. N]